MFNQISKTFSSSEAHSFDVVFACELFVLCASLLCFREKNKVMNPLSFLMRLIIQFRTLKEVLEVDFSLWRSQLVSGFAL